MDDKKKAFRVAEYKSKVAVCCNFLTLVFLTVQKVTVYIGLLFPWLCQKGSYINGGQLSQCHCALYDNEGIEE